MDITLDMNSNWKFRGHYMFRDSNSQFTSYCGHWEIK